MHEILKVLKKPYKYFTRWWVVVKYSDSKGQIKTTKISFTTEKEALKIKRGKKILIHYDNTDRNFE